MCKGCSARTVNHVLQRTKNIMIQLRCTGKVQKQLCIKPNELSEIKEPDSTLGNWYLNITTIDRRKTFIFMNESTLLSFILYGVKKSNSSRIHEMFLRALNQLLLFEGFDFEIINKVNDEYLDIEYTKTHSRSLLGNMNDLVENYKYQIYAGGGLQHCDLTAIIKELNRMPQKNIGWEYSINVARELLTKQNH